jgi:hypothetical protein
MGDFPAAGNDARHKSAEDRPGETYAESDQPPSGGKRHTGLERLAVEESDRYHRPDVTHHRHRPAQDNSKTAPQNLPVRVLSP